MSIKEKRKICDWCKSSFKTKYKYQKYCSINCKLEHDKEKRKTIVNIYGVCSECLDAATTFLNCKPYCKHHYNLLKNKK